LSSGFDVGASEFDNLQQRETRRQPVRPICCNIVGKQPHSGCPRQPTEKQKGKDHNIKA
jgi:hypothetical protein